MQVGHDWGGAVTWTLAEDFAHRLKKVVIVNCPHGSVFYNALRSNFRQMRRSWYIGTQHFHISIKYCHVSYLIRTSG